MEEGKACGPRRSPSCVGQTCPLFDDSLASLCEQGEEIHLRKGEETTAALFGDTIPVIEKGALAVLIGTSEGKTRSLFVAGPGCMLNVMRISGDTKRHKESFNDAHFVYALSDTCFKAVPIQVMRDEFMRNPIFAYAVLGQVSDRYKDTLNNMTLLEGTTGVERIKTLFSEVEAAGVDPASMTHELIGRLLDMNRVSVSRLMGEVLKSI